MPDMPRQIQYLVQRQPSLDEEARRKAAFNVGRTVRVTSTYYGPDLFGCSGMLVSIDPHSPYPYNVAVENVPGFGDPVVRSFDWYEIDA